MPHTDAEGNPLALSVATRPPPGTTLSLATIHYPGESNQTQTLPRHPSICGAASGRGH